VIANILFLACSWLFLLAVIGSIALRAWYRREAEAAAKTQRVMNSLLHDTTHQWEQDAL